MDTAEKFQINNGILGIISVSLGNMIRPINTMEDQLQNIYGLGQEEILNQLLVLEKLLI